MLPLIRISNGRSFHSTTRFYRRFEDRFAALHVETRALQSFLVPRNSWPKFNQRINNGTERNIYIFGKHCFRFCFFFLKRRKKKKRKVRKNGLRFSSTEIDILPPFDYERSFPIFNSRRILGPDRRARLEEGNDRAKKNQRATGAVEAGG